MSSVRYEKAIHLSSDVMYFSVHTPSSFSRLCCFRVLLQVDSREDDVCREKHMTSEDKCIALSYLTEDISDLTRTVCVMCTVTVQMAITPFRVIQGHRFWYQSKVHIRLPISD